MGSREVETEQRDRARLYTLPAANAGGSRAVLKGGVPHGGYGSGWGAPAMEAQNSRRKGSPGHTSPPPLRAAPATPPAAQRQLAKGGTAAATTPPRGPT